MNWRNVSEMLWRVTEDNPPAFPAGFVPDVAKDDGRGDHIIATNATIGDLLGLTFAIEYQSQDKSTSRRRITVIEVVTIGGETSLVSRCHETQKIRSFRLAGIQRITDWASGRVFHDPKEYFIHLFGQDLDSILEASFDPIKLCRPGLTFLSALAHSDGRLLEAEITQALDYCEEVCQSMALKLDENKRKSLRNFVIRFRPEQDSIIEAIDYFRKNEQAARKLEKHAIRLMNVDGVQAPEEISMILSFKGAVFD